MKFVLDAEQRLFTDTLHALLTGADTARAVRAWAAGDTKPGRALWSALADAGVFALAVPEAHGGAGPLPVELVCAAEQLGRHAVPGPFVETLAAAELLGRLGDDPLAATWLPRIAAGEALVSLTLPPAVPYALDGDVADLVLTADAETVREATAHGGTASLDPSRRLLPVVPGEPLVTGAAAASAAAYDLGALLCAAQQLGLGRALLDVSVEYARTRQQFGHPIGEYQAVKHHLADVLVELEYARPLLFGAALAYRTPEFSRDVSAAKAAASAASYLAARVALQVHGAIGYTDEYDPSLWIRKVRALYSAWGSPASHRARVVDAL
ncbi:acyl-CoA dehydrogenase [Actinoallomurus bryophytorum]|uniref:Alkylation response protein AidB-like acyl-CoA dehydrogenase n=1 Tax=Actinoallomurus bryophytorum TaxID=1490222 RepID=A0A543BZ74_9ACTN|nr:acyl-CoA dehydrogenase family protein [Actinoallomurus bryophytorum]TQL90119.1 alkylation response protein AidB-like acyl-CoA dehydrogenase [Actinoallomurus bryophytorum]